MIQKWGDSLGLRIPGSLAKAMNLRDGASVVITGENDRLVIRPVRKESLRSKLKKVTKDNLHSEVETGPARALAQTLTKISLLVL